MSEKPLWQWSAREVVAATTRGDVKAEEVARAVAERVAAANPAVNAVTLDLCVESVAAARALDEAFAGGAAPGALHGVPVTIKDNIDVAGQRTPNGLPALERLVANDDSPVTRNWLGAGAVLVGRTNTPEVSMRPTTDNPLYGLTLNPWDAAWGVRRVIRRGRGERCARVRRARARQRHRRLGAHPPRCTAGSPGSSRRRAGSPRT